MTTEPLDLTHQQLLQDRLRAIEIPISEFSFANLYLFRDTHNYEVIREKEIFIKGRSYEGKTYVIPTRDVRRIDPDHLRKIIGTADYMYPIPELWLTAFPEDIYEAAYDEGDSDYLYLTDRIATYAGKKLHKKKNLLNYFIKQYQHDALPLTEDRTSDAVAILNDWLCESKQSEDDTDFAACREALVMMDDLILCGGICYTEGKPSGVILGEELNEDTFALHFVKALTEYKGIYQYIFNSIAGVLPKKYTYLNFEQDLGVEALRHSKESYMPVKKLLKYRVSLKK